MQTTEISLDTPSYSRLAILDSLPVLGINFPLGLAWGILWMKASFSPFLAILYAIFVYGGTVQYLGLSFLMVNAPLYLILFTIIPVAIRNSFYTVALINKLPKNLAVRLYTAFTLVDTIYVIISNQKDSVAKNSYYVFPLTFISHMYWIVGTIAGVFFSSKIDSNLIRLDFVLPALFVVMIMDQYKKFKTVKPVLIYTSIAAISFLILKQGWFLPSLILSTLYCLKTTKKEVLA